MIHILMKFLYKNIKNLNLWLTYFTQHEFFEVFTNSTYAGCLYTDPSEQFHTFWDFDTEVQNPYEWKAYKNFEITKLDPMFRSTYIRNILYASSLFLQMAQRRIIILGTLQSYRFKKSRYMFLNIYLIDSLSILMSELFSLFNLLCELLALFLFFLHLNNRCFN